jgi:hypothetical protein
MNKTEKIRELFIELINKQLEPHSVTYEDVKENPSWYMQYNTTLEDEQIFLKYCIKRIKEVLKVNTKRAEQEAQWFLLQWGLTTNINSINTDKINKTSKDKNS